MRAEFPHASESFKRENPEIFGAAGDGETVREEPAAPSKFEIKSEKVLQQQIVDHLERNGVVVIRSRTDKKTTTAVGIPDLLFAIKGRAIAFEAKLPGKKPTEEQAKMMQLMSRNGWLCIVIHSYDEAVEEFRKLSV